MYQEKKSMFHPKLICASESVPKLVLSILTFCVPVNIKYNNNLTYFAGSCLTT